MRKYAGHDERQVSICHIARDIASTGGGEVVKQVANHMASAGHSVTIITDTEYFECAPGIRVKRTFLGGRLLRWKPRSQAGWIVRHSLQIVSFTISSSALAISRKLSGDVIFNHNCESLVGQILVMHNTFFTDHKNRSLGKVASLLRMLHPVRFMRISKEVLLTRSALNKVLVSVSHGAKGDVIALAGDDRRVRVIPNGVDTAKFAVDLSSKIPQMVQAWSSNGIQETVLFIGHEWKRKGLDELMSALALLPASTGLIVVGGASQNLDLYKQRAREIGVAGRILFAGEWPDVRPFMAAADIFCLPSHSETMPLVALEALAAGLPIVLTPACPAADLIVEGKNGYISGGNPRDIADAIVNALVISHGADTSTLAKKSVESHAWAHVAEAYIELAREVRDTNGVLISPAKDDQQR